MRLRDSQTGQEGYTLAAVLVLGAERAITNVLPHFKTDALCRINDTFLYDDRDVIRCNMIRSLDRLMTFAKKHLPEVPFLDGRHRISLRDTILREVFLNLLIHREVSNSHPASFTIFKDTMVAENWNIPYHKATVSLNELTPHPKNPTIARFFANMGYVEELGVGRRTLLKYGPAYFDGRDVAIEEDDVFRITIPYKPTILPVGGINGTINGTIKLVYDAIIENAGASGPKLSELTGVSLRTLKRYVAELVEKRMVEYRGSKKTGGYYPVET